MDSEKWSQGEGHDEMERRDEKKEVKRNEEKAQLLRGKRKRTSSAEILSTTFEQVLQEANLYTRARFGTANFQAEESATAKAANTVINECYSK